jgi:hypothetical protein
LVLATGAAAFMMIGPAGLVGLLGSTSAGAQTTLSGYNASALAIGAQFGFNVPNVVPLPNENLVEEDVPFARTDVGDGPVVDALGAPYYPGDIAADLGSLLETFGAPALPLNDPLLAESKYPTSPGYPAHVTFGVAPAASTALQPSIYSSSADSSVGGGDSTGTVADLSLDNLAATAKANAADALKKLSTAASSTSSSPSLLDIGNVSATNSVSIGASSVTATSTSTVKTLDIAGLVLIGGLTATATATSDGTTGTPTASLHLGQVTVDGVDAYIDATGVHINSSSSASTGITPAQLQQTVDATLAQDGISIRVLDPELTTSGAQASANAGGLVIAISHQFDVPFIPGEPTIPVPDLGHVGLPAGLYTATTSITFGLAESMVDATGVAPQASSSTTSSGISTFPVIGGVSGTFGTGFTTTAPPLTSTLPPTGPGSATGNGVGGGVITSSVGETGTAFPIRGVPAPLGWTVAALLACLLAAYPLLLVARWQFVSQRRR